ncbi:MAG: hypothetical protein ACR2Q4_14345 [Geminicoccaceae bacterium]
MDEGIPVAHQIRREGSDAMGVPAHLEDGLAAPEIHPDEEDVIFIRHQRAAEGCDVTPDPTASAASPRKSASSTQSLADALFDVD